ncbi:MAG: Hsp20/alpha crystallin family protein [Pseudomonadales bacterium]|jgi:HSP20 family protein|nr:Hsp20/alpha crystallin family protein [Pseudomonadales bacterium]
MNVVRWSPFRELDNLFQTLDRPQAAMRRADWLPLVDIRETEKAYEIDIEVPAVASSDLSVSVVDGVLTVGGERKIVEQPEEGKRLHRVERRYGRFVRNFQLPDDADQNQIEAETKDGVLYLNVTKRESAVSKTIEVKIS